MILLYLACLFPLAVYLLILAMLNRGPQAVAVSGPWDFAGVLLAVSGFLVFGGPAVLTGVYEQARLAALLDPAQLTWWSSMLRPLGQTPWAFWLALWLLYFLSVACGGAFLLWRRQGALVVYNITSDDFAVVLHQVLHRLGLEGANQGRRILLHRPGESAPGAVLELVAWPMMRNVILHADGDLVIRTELERELVRALAAMESGTSPLSGWLLGLAGGFFLSLFFGLVTYLFLLAQTLFR